MAAVVLALSSSLMWGVADFSGGLLTRRLPLAAVVSVLGSLFPVVTVVLAHVLLRERISRVQRFGVAVALVGVAVVSAA